MTTRLAMFPLGSVLVPHALLPLHIFESRYRVLMFDCVRGEPEFGVVLIERGSEVGGDDQRFSVGTVARIAEAEELADGRWIVVAVGGRRIRVSEWLADDPYPVARVEDLAEPPWSSEAESARLGAEPVVRRSLELAAELHRRLAAGAAASAGVAGDQDATAVPPRIDLADDPRVAAWQLVAAAPLGSLDRQHLLEMEHHADRLRHLRELSEEQAAMFAHRLNNE